MWYVEARIGDEFELWVGLTKEQSLEIHSRYSNSDFGFVRSGRM